MNYWKHESRLRLTGRSAAYSSNQLTRWFIGSEVRRELSWRLPSELNWASGVVSYRPQNFRWGGRVWETPSPSAPVPRSTSAWKVENGFGERVGHVTLSFSGPFP